MLSFSEKFDFGATMITYNEVLKEISALSEPDFADFQKRIIGDKALKIFGVRTPVLRKLAKRYADEPESFSSFPNEYYEVVFLKLTLAARMPYDRFLEVCDDCVCLLTDWALCDCFAPACIEKNREEFIPYIKKYAACTAGHDGGMFVRRFAFTTLLHFYVDEDHLPLIFECVSGCRNDGYYVVMGAAWLLAEVLIKHYERGYEFLNSSMCDINIRNKAISKACDSFRVNDERKRELRRLRRS